MEAKHLLKRQVAGFFHCILEMVLHGPWNCSAHYGHWIIFMLSGRLQWQQILSFIVLSLAATFLIRDGKEVTIPVSKPLPRWDIMQGWLKFKEQGHSASHNCRQSTIKPLHLLECVSKIKCQVVTFSAQNGSHAPTVVCTIVWNFDTFLLFNFESQVWSSDVFYKSPICRCCCFKCNSLVLITFQSAKFLMLQDPYYPYPDWGVVASCLMNHQVSASWNVFWKVLQVCSHPLQCEAPVACWNYNYKQ